MMSAALLIIDVQEAMFAFIWMIPICTGNGVVTAGSSTIMRSMKTAI